MTREELKNIVRHVFHFYDVNAENCNWTDMNEACGEILKILEQEPCEDCTSREDTMSMILCYGNEIKSEVMDDIKASMIKLPSVTPLPKIGHWIEERNDYGELEHWHCSNCYDNTGFITTCKWRYCPSCGTKMEE